MGTSLMASGGVLASLPTVAGNTDDFKDFNTPQFLPRIQFYSKGRTFADGSSIPAGHYGIPSTRNDHADDLGSQIEVMPLVRKIKAMDLSDLSKVIVTCDASSDDYQRIKQLAKKKVKDNLFGPSYLVVERKTGGLYELYCGSRTLSDPATGLLAYCPISLADCEREGWDETEARDPKTALLGSTLVKKPPYQWFVSTISKSSLPITNMPANDVLLAEATKFMTLEPGVQSVDEADGPSRAH